MQTLVYVAENFSNKVAVIDADTNTIIKTITVGSRPREIAITSDGKYVYVTNSASANVSVIDTATNIAINTISVGVSPFGVAVTPDSKYVYVANAASDNVSVIYTITNMVVDTIAVGNQPQGVAMTPNGAHAYVTNALSNNVSVIETSTNSVITTIPVGGFAERVTITPNGDYAYVSKSNGVSVIDISTNSVIKNIVISGVLRGIAVTPDGKFVYVANTSGDSVSVIETATNTVSTTIAVSNAPYGLDVTPEGDYVYVANGNDIAVINTSTNTIYNTIPLNLRPYGVAAGNIPEPEAKLSIEKIDYPDPATLGEELTYSIPVYNQGPVAANGVILVDTLPSEVEFVSASSTQGTCSESSGEVKCDIGTIEIDHTVTVTITVKPLKSGVICNNVTVLDDKTAYITVSQCTMVFETACVEVIRIFGNCDFEAKHCTTLTLPFRTGQDIKCRVHKSKCEITHKKRCSKDFINVTLRISVKVDFYCHAHSKKDVDRTISFNKTITMYAPKGSKVSCKIIKAKCDCSLPDDKKEIDRCTNKVFCTLNAKVNLKSKKDSYIDVPLLGECKPCSCTECPAGWLEPGDKLYIDIVPERQVSSIEVTWEDGGRCSSGTLYLNGEIYGAPVKIPNDQGEYSWGDIDRTVSSAYIFIFDGCANIIKYEVIYIEEWIRLAPGDSYPLPAFPPLITKISFEAKTDAGQTSTVGLYYMGVPLFTSDVYENIQTITWDLSTPFESSELALKNDGASVVYVRNVYEEG